MELLRRIGCAILGGIDCVALYYLGYFVMEIERTTEGIILCAVIGAIIGAIVPIVTVIVFALLFLFVRGLYNESKSRD